MHTSAQGAPAASRKPAPSRRAPEPIRVDGPVPFPDNLPGARSPKGLFWLAAWFGDQRRVEEFKAFTLTFSTWNKVTRNNALWSAFSEASRHLQTEAHKSLQYVKDEGYLLCAWAGTTALEQPQ